MKKKKHLFSFSLLQIIPKTFDTIYKMNWSFSSTKFWSNIPNCITIKFVRDEFFSFEETRSFIRVITTFVWHFFWFSAKIRHFHCWIRSPCRIWSLFLLFNDETSFVSLRYFMEPTMAKTHEFLAYLMPLINCIDSECAEFIQR